MATNPFDQFDEPVPDSRLPVDPYSGGADDPGPAANDAYGGGGSGTGRPLRVVVHGDAAPTPQGAANPFDQFDDAPPADTTEAPQEPPAPTMGGSIANAAAAVGQGLSGIPDAATNAAGAVMGEAARYGGRAIGSVADAMGLNGDSIRAGGEEAAANFYKPITIGGLIEKAAPTPEDGVGKGVRLAGQLGGGFLTVPGITPMAKAIPEMMGLNVPARVLPKALTEGQEVAAAAGRVSKETGTPMRPIAADVGGQRTKALTEFARKTPFGERINKAADVFAGDVSGARDVLAARSGTVRGAEGAGEVATAGADKFIKSSSQQGRRLYDTAEKLAGEARVSPAKALEELDRSIAELADTPGGADGIGELTKLREALAKGDVSVAGIRRMRSVLGQKYLDDGLRMSDLQRRVNRVIDAAGEDVTSSLNAAGKGDAATAYRAADDLWKARLNTIDKNLTPIIGKDGTKSGEEVLKALERAADGNGRRFQKFIEALPPEEAGSVKASLIARLGGARASAQNAAGDAFSLETFLTRWNTMTPRAKVVLFDKPTRAAMNDLARIAEGARATRTFANTSNSGTNIQAGAAVSSIGSTAALVATGNLLAAFLTSVPVAGQYITTRMMTSPRFVRWLVKTGGLPAKASPGVIRSHVAQLTAIATRDPASADITAFQRMLQGANDNLGRSGSAAASPDQRPDQQ